jgi:cyclopropane fatty-acyl-phospholipid synthase-like methyltransferase
MSAGIDSPLAVLRTILPTLHGVTILDIGCGDGKLAGGLAAAGAQVTGIDPNQSSRSRARRLPAGRRGRSRTRSAWSASASSRRGCG